MNAVRQLYRLQEIDTELASREQVRAGVKARIGESEEVLRTARALEQEKKQLEETTHRQHTIEWEIDDISTKTAKFEEELYSGRTTSPKELTGLQQEIEALKTKRSSLEDRRLNSWRPSKS
jgi:predicted  nucleic acid-binding Zn-ribbon protein